MDSFPTVDYYLASFPLALAHLIVPPLSYIRSLELPPGILQSFFQYLYEILPECFFEERFIESLMSKKGSENWTLVTHLFVHADYGHMFNNLTALLQFGFPIYKLVGIEAYHFLFLFGGVCAAMPSMLHTLEMNNTIKQFEAITSIKERNFIPNFISKYWNNSMRKLGTSIVELPTRSCGSSGAVMAILGASMVIKTFDCVNSIKSFISMHHNQQHRRYNEDNNPLAQFQKLEMFLWNASFVARAVHYISCDIETIFKVPSSTSSQSSLDTVVQFFNRKMVGHAAHIQGAIVGILFASTVIGVTFIRRYFASHNFNRR